MRYVVRAAVVFVLVSALVVGSVFVFVDFGVRDSESSVESVVSAAYANGTTLDLSRGLYIHVVGDTRADREFEAALVAEFLTRGVDAVAVTELRATYDRPILVVGHDIWTFDYTWTFDTDPVRGGADVHWRYLYAQTGDLTPFGSSTPETADFSADWLAERITTDGFETVTLSTGFEFISEGEFTVRDDTTGVFSVRDYDRHVQTVVAGATVDALLATHR